MLSREILLSVLDYAPDAILLIDEAGEILFANRQASSLLGYGDGELQGQSVEFLIPQRYRLPHISHRLRFTDERRTRFMGGGRELFALCRDGSERRVEISLAPIQYGLRTLMVAAVRDCASQDSARPPSAHCGRRPIPSEPSSTRILVVEDDRIVAVDLQQTLQILGYEAYAIAGSGEAALSAAAGQFPDLALMDVRIQGPMDGIDTALELRERFGTTTVFLTAHADDRTLERAKRALPSGYLVKPVTASALRAAVELALVHRAAGLARRAC